MGAASIADKYISKDGSAPVQSDVEPPSADDIEQVKADLITVGKFILWHDDHKGLRPAPETAFAALCSLTKCDTEFLREMIKAAAVWR